MIPIGYLVDAEDYQNTKFEIETLRQDFESAQSKLLEEQRIRLEQETTANQTIARHAATIQSLNTQLSDMQMERDAALTANKIANTEVANLTTQLQRLQTETTRPLVTRKPTITKTELLNVAGICVDKDDAPTTAQDENARQLILLASMMGFNTWRGFFNLAEVKVHLTYSETNIKHLPGYGRLLGMTFMADTVNSDAIWALSEADFAVYIKGLITMGATAFYFDDANQYRDDRNADGTLKWAEGTLEKRVARVRAYSGAIPLIASLRGNAITAQYKPLFDFVEAQTFGGKITELDYFLKRKGEFEVFNLDGQKNEVSKTYLEASEEIILRNNPRNIYYYPATATEWKTMADRLPTIKRIVTRWMSMAR